MTVNWTEYNKITNIFNVMLGRGHWFRIGNKGEAGFDPEKNDTYFTFELMEKKTISQWKELINLCPGYSTSNNYPISDIYCDIWNYVTDEGKEFCNFLREQRHLGPATYDHEHNYFNWEIFNNCDYDTLQTIIPANQNIPADQIVPSNQQKEENLCMICLDVEANTMVLPCEHCVVCTSCSARLRNTNDHGICVRCRREITHVLG